MSPKGSFVGIIVNPLRHEVPHCVSVLARRLSDQDYRVKFVGAADGEAMITQVGFDYEVIGRDIFPEGWFHKKRSVIRLRFELAQKLRNLEDHLSDIADELSEKFRLIIAESSVVWLCAGVAKRGTPVAQLESGLSIFNMSRPPAWTGDRPAPDGTIRRSTRFKNFKRQNDPIRLAFKFAYQVMWMAQGRRTDTEKKIHQIRTTFPTIIACPEEFEFPGQPRPNEFHVDALVDDVDPHEYREHLFNRDISDTRHIYLSLGHTWHPKQSDIPLRICKTVCEAVQHNENWSLILDAGDSTPQIRDELNGHEVNFIENELSLDELARVDLAIIPGELRMIKRSIVAKAPIICLPRGAVQRGYSERVNYHSLGMSKDVEHFELPLVSESFQEIFRNPTYSLALENMNLAFEQARERDELLDLVQNLLSQR